MPILLEYNTIVAFCFCPCHNTNLLYITPFAGVGIGLIRIESFDVISKGANARLWYDYAHQPE